MSTSDDEKRASTDSRELARRGGELTKALKRALKRRERDLLAFDKKLDALRASSSESAQRSLTRLEKRRERLGDEASSLEGVLEEAEAMLERVGELRANVEFEERRRRRAEQTARVLETENERLTREAAQLREEVEEKSHVIFELQEIVNLLTADVDEDAEEAPADQPRQVQTGVYMHVFKKPGSEDGGSTAETLVMAPRAVSVSPGEMARTDLTDEDLEPLEEDEAEAELDPMDDVDVAEDGFDDDLDDEDDLDDDLDDDLEVVEVESTQAAPARPPPLPPPPRAANEDVPHDDDDEQAPMDLPVTVAED